MGNKINMSFNVSNFESLSENSENKLVGGFSASISGTGDSIDSISNNCDGGNCAVRCGSGQNIACNAAVGCGTKEE